tara:strand:+ start:161 stop:2482 length:2322 start_codon:yes stop_codon:yes gene_type:complete
MKGKKFFRNLKFGVLKPKTFIILFSLFFSSLALAATLSVTLLYQYLPNNPSGLGLACYTSDGALIESDGAQEPNDVAFSNDGLTYFIANESMVSPNGYDITVYKLERPFDLQSLKEDCSQDRFDLGTLARGDGSGPLANGTLTSVWGKLYDMEFSASGDKIFIVNGVSFLMQFSLSKPFDLSTASFDTYQDLAPNYSSLTFNREGTKMFWLEQAGDATKVRTYETSSPFDISSLTLSHTLDLSSTELNTITGTQSAQDMHFNDTGSAAYILIYGGSDNRDLSAIYQFRLSTPYDMSTASLRGKWLVTFENGATGIPTGFTFGDNGMKIYITDIESGTGVDRTNAYSLECPYGIYECTSDPVSELGSQVQLAKENINLNTSVIFKRFEWVKRNRNSENLNSFNININSHNPLLASLAKKFQTSKYINRASLNNNSSSNNKKTKWSYWSHGDISIGNYEGTFLEKPKQIKTKGLTFGTDRKYGDNKFAGFAIRYGENDADIKGSAQQTDMESLTLNIYGIVPRDENKYINGVIGLSALRFDQKYLGKLTGERNGKQAFAAVNYRTKKSYGDLNLTPSGRFTYAVTKLSDYTNFINTIKRGTNVTYEEDTFENGEVAAGFLFDLNDIVTSDGIFKPNGGLEIVLDITPDVKLEYSDQGSSNINSATIKKYSQKNIRGNIGLEAIYNNGMTLSLNYERFQHIDNHRYSHTDSFLIKVGHISKEDAEFAFNFDPLKNNETTIGYTKNINGLNFKISSNYSLMSQIPDYGANIEVSSMF